MERQRRRKKQVALLCLGAALGVTGLIFWFVGRPMLQFVSQPELFRDWVDGHGVFGRLAFLGMMMFQVFVAIIPGEPLEIGAGYAFGVLEGTALCLLATTLASGVIFLIVKKYGMKFVTLFVAEEKIRSLGMEALYQVSKGSPNPPVVIIMRYTGAPECPEDITALIGKGVTYDSGGLNLKAGQRFTTMKHDMAGGGTVIGAMCAIAQQKLRCNVVAVVAACENLISGRAYKPGDIIGSMGGKTIQINSTDAEGRLTLIDAITYAIRYEHASRLVDIATLTGAARRILGEYGAPVLGNDDSLWSALEAGAKGSGELVCRVPLVPDARAKIRGDVCDLLNTSLAETGGMVTAALFIEEFVEGKPWMHIDAAGPLWLDHDMPYTPRGGSGWGVRTLYHMVKGLAR